MAMIYAAVRQYGRQRKQKNIAEQACKEQELQLLKSQVSTANLFGGLNELQAIVNDEDAPQTTHAVQQLTALFAYSVEQATKETVPVAEELSFIEQYLHLQQLRIPESDQLAIKTTISCADDAAVIAPMLLLPFIENALKYGISYELPSAININIVCSHHTLECRVENTDHSSRHRDQTNGMGIANTQKRLELQYPGNHTLEHKSESGIYNVFLKLDLTP